ncbi:hypothetical protein F5Y14DRAFT_379413 [Nemania sp. NC0429]|nr:hypothetical protein F5Y14DRAFT_379413 [Nemania sp. NC0429]
MASSNANIPNAMVQAFGLAREPAFLEPEDTAFIDSYIVLADFDNPSIPRTPEWRSFEISLPCSAIPPTALKAAGTYASSLTSLGPILLNRDMIVDNYNYTMSTSTSTSTPTCSPMSKLRWLGVANILNLSSRSTFAQIFRAAGKDILTRGSVKVRPPVNFHLHRNIDIDVDGAHARHHHHHHHHHHQLLHFLLHDPFACGVLALLRERAGEMGGAFVRRFIFVSEGYEEGGHHAHSKPPSPLELRLNLVVELARPGFSEDGSVDVDIDIDIGIAVTATTDAPKEPLANL